MTWINRRARHCAPWAGPSYNARNVNKLLRHRHFQGLLIGSAVLLVIHVVGTLGYHYLGRPTATWIDSFYMTFITVATIGYGETVDLAHHPWAASSPWALPWWASAR